MKPTCFLLLYIITLSSCTERLDEKIFKNKDITVSWYKVSEITTVHDFIVVSKGFKELKLMEANTAGIHDVLIKNDTIIIQTLPDLIVYELNNKAFDYYVIQDTSITLCQYIKKHIPENAKYHCEQPISLNIKSKF